MAEVIGCLALFGCCGSCFACGRGCKGSSSKQVRDPAEQPERIVVRPVMVTPAVVEETANAPQAQAVASVVAGYLVMTDPVTGEQQLYAAVTPLTPNSATAVLAAIGMSSQADAIDQPVTTEATNVPQTDLKTPLHQS